MKPKKILSQHWLFILIFLLAVFMRVWQVDRLAIFFDDAAYDLITAAVAVETRSLPLLGIPSSVPRFRQGPVTIWYEMGLLQIFGQNLTVIVLAFGAISVAALAAVYAFGRQYLGKKVALITAFLIALSPLAIAGARMPYHTNPLPLAMIFYLWAVVRLWYAKPYSLFLAGLAWAFLFGFELSVFPTILAVPWVLWRTDQWRPIWRQAVKFGAGLSLGLWPQLLYDLTHNFSQVGLFLVWTVYRVVSLFGGEHSASLGKFSGVGERFWHYGGRIFSTDQKEITLVVCALLGLAVVALFKKWRAGKIKPAWEVITAVTTLLTLGYVMHGSPSEAYFPPYIILLPLLVTFALVQIFKKRVGVLIFLLLVWGALSVRSVFIHNFFVSNSQVFSYGCSLSDQKRILNFIKEKSGGNFKLDTTRDLRQFASALNNLQWLAVAAGQPENESGQVFFIEDSWSVLRQNSQFAVEYFGCNDVYYERK